MAYFWGDRLHDLGELSSDGRKQTVAKGGARRESCGNSGLVSFPESDCVEFLCGMHPFPYRGETDQGCGHFWAAAVWQLFVIIS